MLHVVDPIKVAESDWTIPPLAAGSLHGDTSLEFAAPSNMPSHAKWCHVKLLFFDLHQLYFDFQSPKQAFQVWSLFQWWSCRSSNCVERCRVGLLVNSFEEVPLLRVSYSRPKSSPCPIGAIGLEPS